MNAYQGALVFSASDLAVPMCPAVSPVELSMSECSIDLHSEREIQRFTPHSLESLNNAALMSRVDSKFLVPAGLLGELLADMRQSYSILEINGRRSFNYETTYYDTPQFTHYLAHHNGRLNRFKIRKRSYLESGSSFLEVKFKNNRGRTTKSRIRSDAEQLQLDTTSLEFLHAQGIPDPANLQAVQTGRYKRIALASEARGERLTIDCNLSFHDEQISNSHWLGPWVIVEVKQDVMDRRSNFFTWARGRRLREVSFSKYCMGVYFTGASTLKRNRFHPISRRLQSQQVGSRRSALLPDYS